MADYELQEYVDKRLRYFDGQFLIEQDFIDEQKYHIDRRWRHNRTLHSPGVAGGLVVTASGDNQRITVARGTAIDGNGREIVLAADTPIDLANVAGKTWLVYISYQKRAVDPAQQTGSSGDTRWQEAPLIEVVAEGNAPQGLDAVTLSRLVVANDGKVTLDNTARQYAGVRLAGGPTLSASEGGRSLLGGPLRVNGDLSVAGALTPSAGNAETTGILFPKDPGGGAGDAAWVRYYRRGASGEATTLEIGTSDNTEDHIALIASGNVGVGTTAPAYPLHVTKTVTNEWQARFTNGNANVYLSHQAGHGLHINTGGGNDAGRYGLEVRNANQTHLYVRDDGNVGIGNTAPAYALHVTKTLTNDWQARFTNGNANVYLSHQAGHGLHINTGGKNDAGRYGLEVRNADQTHLYVRDDGNVGIGTATPGRPLHVVKTLSNDWQALFTNGNANVYLSHQGGYGMHINTGGKNEAGRYALEVRNADQTHFYVRDDGNVGVGTGGPGYPLHVTKTKTGDWQALFTNGNANVYLNHQGGYGMHINTGGQNGSSRYALQVRNADQTHFYVRDDGNVGIGTDQPGSRLDVRDKSRFIVDVSQENTAYLRFGDDAIENKTSAKIQFAGWGVLHGGLRFVPKDTANSQGKFIFSTGGNDDPDNQTAQMTIQGNGRVGVGTTTPGMSLEVTSPSYWNAPAIGGANGDKRAYLHVSTGDHSLIWDNASAMRFGTETDRGSGYSEWMRIAKDGNVTVQKKLTVLGEQNIIKVATFTLVKTNSGKDDPGAWSVSYSGFSAIYSVFAVLQGHSLWSNSSTQFTSYGHVKSDGAIPQHVFVRVDGHDVNRAWGVTYCSESNVDGEADNTVLFTVVVMGRAS